MEPSKKNILIFGGTFDPPHKAHIMLLKQAYKKLIPQQAVIVPAYKSPFKKQPYTSFKHRKKMLSLLINRLKMKNKFTISNFEKRKGKVTYTFEVLKHFYKKNSKLYFLMGSDSLLHFHKWKKYHEILKMAKLLVGIRKGTKLAARKYGAIFLKGHFPDISSTKLRKEIFIGNFNAIEPEVKKYIIKNNLYNAFLIAKISKILTNKRLLHSQNVAKLAIELAEKHNISLEKAALSALLHDITKDLALDQQIKMAKSLGVPAQKLLKISRLAPGIIHQWAGKYFCQKKLKIKDKEILNAISAHATGHKKMSKLAKLIYIADFSSYDRNFPQALTVRKIAFLDLDNAFNMVRKLKTEYIKKTGKWLYETK